jgi:hypothetical protein
LGVEAIWDAVVNGRSAIKEISSWDVALAARGGRNHSMDNRTLVEDRKLTS